MAFDALASLDRRLGIGSAARPSAAPGSADLPPALRHYERVQLAGRGSFGQAWLVRDTRSGVHYVIKEIPTAQMSPRERRDALNEIAVLARLHHPNIVKYRESCEQRTTLYIVMEYADGGDLWGLLQGLGGRKLPEADVMNYFVQICMALKHMHDLKVLHRDLKTGNVFLTSTGVVKLGDFGISTSLMNTAAVAHTVCGTPNYFSPEMCQGRPYNNKADLWALGCILYELMAGHLAFQGATMQELYGKVITCKYAPLPDVYSAELRHLCQRILCREQAMRPDINAVLRAYVVQKYLRAVEGGLKQSQAALAQQHEEALEREREVHDQRQRHRDAMAKEEQIRAHEREMQREREREAERAREAERERAEMEEEMEAILKGLREDAPIPREPSPEGTGPKGPRQPDIPAVRRAALEEYGQMLSNLDRLHTPGTRDSEEEYSTFGDEEADLSRGPGDGGEVPSPLVKWAVADGPLSDSLTPSMRALLDEFM